MNKNYSQYNYTQYIGYSQEVEYDNLINGEFSYDFL